MTNKKDKSCYKCGPYPICQVRMKQEELLRVIGSVASPDFAGDLAQFCAERCKCYQNGEGQDGP